MASEKPASSVVLRRSVLGVRRADALRLIDELRAQVAQIAGTLRDTWNENQVLKRELAEVRGELERSLGASSGDRAAAEARAEAARLVAAAEEQAALVERQAGERVGEVSGRLVDLLRVREQLVHELRGTLQSYREVLVRAGGIPQVEPDRIADAVPAEAPLRVVRDLPTRRVHVDAGPFAELDDVSGFERVLAAIPGVEDVYVREFVGARASIELSLRGEGDVGELIGAHLAYAADVTARDADSVVVDLARDAAANG